MRGLRGDLAAAHAEIRADDEYQLGLHDCQRRRSSRTMTGMAHRGACAE
jgi:hypothetical protein